jgi:hypothetical protein
VLAARGANHIQPEREYGIG